MDINLIPYITKTVKTVSIYCHILKPVFYTGKYWSNDIDLRDLIYVKYFIFE